MAEAAERLIPVTVPLDLRRTLRPLGGRFFDDGWWRTAHTPDGSATLQIVRTIEGVRARAWGPGTDWMLDRVEDVVGLSDEPESFVTEDPRLRRLARRHRGYRYGATALTFDALVAAVVAQKVTGKEASWSLTGLRRLFSDPAPGPRTLPLPPDSLRMAEAPYWDYHRIGLERRRADILRRLASDRARLDGLGSASSSEAQACLLGYRGVGLWTAAETVAVSHGDADAVSVGDYHLKNLVSWHLRGHPRGTDEEMLALLEPFRPHRGRVIRLLETLGHAPAFGPRMPLRDIVAI